MTGNVLSRRALIAGAAAAVTWAGLPRARAAAPAHTLPDLPYGFDALEGAIDAATMEIHHGRHHAGYVKTLNAALSEQPALAGESLEALFARVSTLPPVIRNHGGGHWNHSLFWTLMAPPGTGGDPSAALSADLQRAFGSLDGFKTAFAKASAGQFGAGWGWLVMTDDGLRITTTANQDNPLMDVAPVRGRPILGVDVWEHAYYLRYQNRRADYLDAWWTVVNWSEVNRLHAAGG